MKAFAYERAADADDAAAAGAGGATYLGGGTNLVDLMKLGVATPDRLVDVSRLPDTIEVLSGGGLRIGAAVRNADLATHPVVRERYPVLSQALLAGASGQLRNLATIGGNLLQRTRCSYFQDVTKPCNKRLPGSGCPARQGEHGNLAILGHSEHCVATHPSDMTVALTALGATVRVHGGGSFPMPGLHRLPGDAPERDTNLAPGDMITGIEIGDPAPRSTYRKVRERASFSFAVVSVAAAATLRDGVIEECRIALGGVAHVPWRASAAERVLAGAPPTVESFAAAADAELARAEPLRDNAYKVPLTRNVLISTLAELCA